jgi:sugar phosphate permease
MASLAPASAAGKPAARFAQMYVPFAAGCLLSYLFRTVNAVISPDLTRELALGDGALGFLTGAYFVAFAAMQTPVAMLLDRYGPRRVEPLLLIAAGAGALVFATAGALRLAFALALYAAAYLWFARGWRRHAHAAAAAVA